VSEDANATPRADRRATEIRHLDATCVMPSYRDREEWLARAAVLREQIRAATGLWPMPRKTPLGPKVFGRLERDGYTIEKVYLRTLPGFYLCGNLFRPTGGDGPFPGILLPHGHSPVQVGRLAAAVTVGATLARLGCVTFAYDMVGFVDTNQVPHAYGSQREWLWGISVMGLQLWNSIRATDFITSLPDVDAARIGCAGSSGGGTQTYMLTAVDDRIQAAVAVGMVSSIMQGGCLCENAPGLRIDTNNMEIAALAAPRPLLLVAATGDWTRHTPEVEYPAIRDVYRLFDAEEKIDYRIFDSPHNYNQDKREAVCAWFARWLLGIDDPERCREAAYPPDRQLDLLVFYGRTPPRGRLDEQGLTQKLIASTKRRINSLRPRDKRGLGRLRRTLGVGLRHALAAEYPLPEAVSAEPQELVPVEGGTAGRLVFGRAEQGDAIPAIMIDPTAGVTSKGVAVILIDAKGKAAVADLVAGTLSPLARACLDSGCTVLALDCFATGESPPPLSDPAYKYLETYNRTVTAIRVQDILTAMAYLQGVRGQGRVAVIGTGKAGLWAMLAAGISAPEALVADAACFDTNDDEAYLADCYVPSLLSAGGFETAQALAFPCRLFIHNTGDAFRACWAADLYRALDAAPSFKIQAERAQTGDILQWVSQG